MQSIMDIHVIETIREKLDLIHLEVCTVARLSLDPYEFHKYSLAHTMRHVHRCKDDNTLDGFKTMLDVLFDDIIDVATMAFGRERISWFESFRESMLDTPRTTNQIDTVDQFMEILDVCQNNAIKLSLYVNINMRDFHIARNRYKNKHYGNAPTPPPPPPRRKRGWFRR